MSIYAVDADLEVPGDMIHELSEDGLTMTSTFRPAGGGNALIRVSWVSLEKAQAHYEDARQSAKHRAARLVEKISEVPGGATDHAWLKKFGDTGISLYVNVGPPTWWAPKFDLALKEKQVRWGWLWIAFVFAWGDR